MRERGQILLVSTYELEHQPLALASPLAWLRGAGYDAVAVDSSVEPLTDEAIARARLVAISVPMHTATRLGVAIAERVRRINPGAHICCYGLYALLNADYLRPRYADSVIGGEFEAPLLELVEQLAAGAVVSTATPPPNLDSLPFVVPDRTELPGLREYAGLRHGDEIVAAGYCTASRG